MLAWPINLCSVLKSHSAGSIAQSAFLGGNGNVPIGSQMGQELLESDPIRLLVQGSDGDDSECEQCPSCGRPMRLVDRRDKLSWSEIMTSSRRPDWYGHDTL